LTTTERVALEHLARAFSERIDRAIRAKLLLAVTDGASFTAADHPVGRRNGDTVARLVAHFNRERLAVVTPRYGDGPPVQYCAAQRARILASSSACPTASRAGFPQCLERSAGYAKPGGGVPR
jgi:hypothetical protein